MSNFKGDQFYMDRAVEQSIQSEDPVTQVGACIINEDNEIVGEGYNRMPSGREHFLWVKEKCSIDNKHLYVCHAELNAIVNKTCMNLENCVMYVTHHPCNQCAKLIKQSKIKEVVYESDKWPHKLSTEASKRILEGMTRKFLRTVNSTVG